MSTAQAQSIRIAQTRRPELREASASALGQSEPFTGIRTGGQLIGHLASLASVA